MHGLSSEERDALVKRFGRSLAAGEVLYEPGESSQHCYLLHEGEMRLSHWLLGRERPVLRVSTGSLFGEEALLESPLPRILRAVAITDAVVLQLDRKTVHALITNPSTSKGLVEQLVRRLLNHQEQLQCAILSDPCARVCQTLLQYMDTDQHVKLSPFDLARTAGLSVDAFHTYAHRLMRLNHLRLNADDLVVQDSAALKAIVARELHAQAV